VTQYPRQGVLRVRGARVGRTARRREVPPHRVESEQEHAGRLAGNDRRRLGAKAAELVLEPPERYAPGMLHDGRPMGRPAGAAVVLSRELRAAS